MDFDMMTREQLIAQIKELTKQLKMAEIFETKSPEISDKGSEEIWRIFFELAPDGCYVNELDGKFLAGNKAAEEITGYSREELIGKSFLEVDLISDDQKLKAASGLARNAQGLPDGPTEYTLNRKDGSKVVVETKSYPVKIGGRLVVLGCAREITARKQAEEKLQDYREQLETLVHRQAYELQKFSDRIHEDKKEEE